MNRQSHWDQVYTNKHSSEMSWTQQIPSTSLSLFKTLKIPKEASIIDVGGGDGKFAGHLLAMGYQNVTILDISAAAIEKARASLGENAQYVQMIVSDIVDFDPKCSFDVWHDRATFHFMYVKPDIDQYLSIARKSVNGYMIVGTFSDRGPNKCSGLDVRRYSEAQLTQQIFHGFKKIRCITEDHITPFNTVQNFLFCSFKRA